MLPQVEEAKHLMTEAMEWSVFSWLFQKSRVREAADRANVALDRLSQSVKNSWSAEVKAAYSELMVEATGQRRKTQSVKPSVDSDLQELLRKVRKADDAAHRARMTAEETFEVAERQLNTDLARKGCRQAIHSWELYERAIRRAEALPGSSKPAS